MASKGTDEKLEHLRPNRGLKVGCCGITACGNRVLLGTIPILAKSKKPCAVYVVPRGV